LLYKIVKGADIAYGIAQFPDFSISISGTKQADAEHTANISSYRTLSTLVIRFVLLMAQIEEQLGVNSAQLLQMFDQGQDAVAE
jgi:hypothetical protein